MLGIIQGVVLKDKYSILPVFNKIHYNERYLDRLQWL